jgi:hypothetical protein
MVIESIHGQARQGRLWGLLGSVLLPVLFLPTLPLYFGVASSMALGTSVAAAIAISVAWWKVPRGRYAAAIFLPSVMVPLAVLALMVHGVGAALQGPFDFVRAGASIVPFLLLLLGGSAIARLFAAAGNSDVDRALRVDFAVMCVVGIFGVLSIAPPTAIPRTKPVFPFTEPSHFALAFVPLLMYRCTVSKGWYRLLFLLFGFVVALLLQNLTLIIGCILIAIVTLRHPAMLIFIALLALAGAQIDSSYYVERLDLLGDTQNLSSLVYLQGWEMIGESLSNSHWWGLGFQQLGVHGTDVGAADSIQKLVDASLNQLDGSFTGAKIISEFGIFGIVLVLYWLLIAARSALAIRRGISMSAAEMFAYCTIVSSSLDLLVRGSGYFSTSMLFLIAGFWFQALRGRYTDPLQMGDVWIAPSRLQ